MGKLIIEGLTMEDFMDQLAPMLRMCIKEVLDNQVQDKWLSVEEARNMWSPAISRNTLTKWSELYSFKTQRFGGQKKWLMSDILRQSNTIEKYKQS